MSRSLSYAPGALRPLRVSVNASASLVGNVVYSACQAGLLIVLARLGSTAMVGQYALGLAISGPVMLLASLQLRSVQATDAANNNHFSEYLALRLTTTVLALVVIAIIGGVATRSVAAASVILLVGALKNADALSDVYRGLMQQAERMERVAVSMVLRGIVSLGPFALALALGASLPAALAIAIGAGLLVWATWDVNSARILLRESADDSRALRRWLGAVPRFERERLIGLARTALPLGFVAMLLSLNSYAPQYAVKHLGTDAELGVFAALLYVASAPRVLIGAAGQSASPRLAKLYESGNVRAFRALHTRLLRFGVGVGVVSLIGATLLGKPLLHLVFGAEYATHARLLIELSAVSCVNHIVSLQGYTVTATRCFRAQFPVSLLVALSTILSAYALVPRHGASGAAVAILIGLLVQGAGYSVLLRAAVRRLEQGIRTGEQHALA
jgi:O-antigen/teichoic acid export membrane protein